MSTNVKNTSGPSDVMDTTDEQCHIFPQDFPTDILLQVGESRFYLHKIMLLAKSNYIRRLILESEEPDMKKIDLSNFPGGANIFDKVAKFCYGVNFEITQNNIAALHCAAEYLEMTDEYCDGNLASRTYAFLTHVALTSLSGAITVLNSCEDLLPIAEELNIVHQCVEVISAKASNEANFPSSPLNWWAEELSIVHITFFQKIIDSMKSRGVKEPTIAEAITTYAKRSLPDLVTSIKAPISNDSISRTKQQEILASIVALMPIGSQQRFFSINFLCSLLRAAIFVENDDECKKQLENQISGVLEHVTVDDLLTLSYMFDGEKLSDMGSVRRIVNRFMEKEKIVPVFNSDEYQAPSWAMLKVVKTVDAFLCVIANTAELTISKFNGIANLVPKNAREVDDDLYRAIDIYLQAHPNLDEIEQEKICSTMDPLKLSAEARVHASQNKRFPLQIVLHTLYHDQLHVRSGQKTPDHDAQSMRLQVHADVVLAKENENLRSELLRMKMYISDMEKKKLGTPSTSKMKKHTIFSSVSKTLGKLNPFKKESKDTSNIDDGIHRTKPRRRRFSMS